MSTTGYQKMIDDFENHYHYDCTYMREFLESSPEGYAKFNDFLPLTAHREKLNPEDYWITKLAAMQVEDCDDCLQLNVRMALEDNVSKQFIKTVLKNNCSLPDAQKDVYNYAKHVASNNDIDPDLVERIKSRYNKGDLLELGLCVATAKVFPTIKRALGYTKSCNLIEIKV